MNLRLPIVAFIAITAVACSREQAQNAQQKAEAAGEAAVTKVADAIDVAVPIRGKDDPAQRERERFDEQWRGLPGFRGDDVRPSQGPAAPELEVSFVSGAKETLKGLNPAAVAAMPVSVPIQGDVAGPSVLKTQVFLDRIGFSVGALDGRWGRNSSIAVWWYQRSRGLEATGVVDQKTFRAIAQAAGATEALVQHRITEEDVKGPFVTIPEDVYDQEKLDCLCYESLAEQLAERFHASVGLLETLNPDVKLAELKAGDAIWVPNVRPPVRQDQPDIARVVISIKGNSFNAFDANGNLIFHAPTTLGSEYDPSPTETLEILRTVHDPHFHYQPKLFHEVPDDDPEANLHPGPNSPVGVVWIALTKPHYGIHGTKDPESIGYASSHGCVRLTNWDAAEVGYRISPKVKVEFRDTRKE
ncbi:MAG: L,D-transpeptidase family protein [Thermoanaerobaculia bacterium]